MSVVAGTIEGMIQVCLNGPRSAGDGAAVPLSPGAMAESAARAVVAGAAEVHVHPKTPCGDDTLSPRAVAEVVTAIRAAVDVPVGVTTGAWAEPDPGRRVERVRAWTVLPDHASVNWHEPGAELVAAALLERGVGVEAGLWSGTDGPRRLLASPLAPRVLRVLAEVMDTDPGTAEESARSLAREPGKIGKTPPRNSRGGWGWIRGWDWRTCWSCRTGSRPFPTPNWCAPPGTAPIFGGPHRAAARRVVTEIRNRGDADVHAACHRRAADRA